MTDKPTVLFVCIHNAGRSQMAAGYMKALSGDAVEVLSGGSEPGNQINPVAIQAMAEEGIDISEGVPQLMTTEQVHDSDVVITMGCGDVCPIFPANGTKTGNSSTRLARALTRSVPFATTSKRGSKRCSRRSFPQNRPHNHHRKNMRAQPDREGAERFGLASAQIETVELDDAVTLEEKKVRV